MPVLSPPPPSASVDLWMPAIFSDHMVLQRSEKCPIWGTAGPGEEVTIRMAGQTWSGRVHDDGRWKLFMDLRRVGGGPHEMTVTGVRKQTISDVMVGEVWLAAGQSNMQMALRSTVGAQGEIAKADDSSFREFQVPPSDAVDPRNDCRGRWIVSSPQTAGDFSGVGYYFARVLRVELGVPVGIIHSSRGATPCEAWISGSAIGKDPVLQRGAARLVQAMHSHPGKWKAHVQALSGWMDTNGRSDQPHSVGTEYSQQDSSVVDWVPVMLPGTVSNKALPPAGAVWIRRTVRIPRDLAGNDLALDLGLADSAHEVFWNGEVIRRVAYADLPAGTSGKRSIVIPGSLVTEGIAVLAVRFFSPSGPPSLSDAPMLGSIPLAGEWLARSEFGLPSLARHQRETIPVPPPLPPPAVYTAAGVLFNAMIQPVCSYGIRGVIWYQGESNVGRAWQYRTTFPLLIEDWRRGWGRKDLPFYFCQLANYGKKQTMPGESKWAELREAQSRALEMAHTGQAVLIDAGESDDIHPRDKKSAGLRLARIALERDYGRPMASSGPVFESMQIDGGTVVLRFSCADGGLVAAPLGGVYHVRRSGGETAPLVRNSPGSDLEGFTICGEDRKWEWAQARIEGDSVRVWSDGVSSPVAIRYAWADNPTCNLANGAGLPASPFRTDDFPAVTRNVQYGIDE